MKTQTLNKNKEYIRVYKKGKCVVEKEIVLYYLKNKKKIIRVGISASKKIGNAVKRNRAKRVIRHAIGQTLDLCKNGYDLVFVARTKTTMIKSNELEKIIVKILRNTDIAKSEEIL